MVEVERDCQIFRVRGWPVGADEFLRYLEKWIRDYTIFNFFFQSSRILDIFARAFLLELFCMKRGGLEREHIEIEGGGSLRFPPRG
ncbi:MAG: hypothetical protein D6805_07035 [Planctomycetota bacterium]|nr:MAG: hypothetical protein D6805_07035 [Planctomycetota bacterium]